MSKKGNKKWGPATSRVTIIYHIPWVWLILMSCSCHVVSWRKKRSRFFRYLQSWQVLHPPQGNDSSSTMRPQPAGKHRKAVAKCALVTSLPCLHSLVDVNVSLHVVKEVDILFSLCWNIPAVENGFWLQAQQLVHDNSDIARDGVFNSSHYFGVPWITCFLKLNRTLGLSYIKLHKFIQDFGWIWY